jgi:peptidoglycan/xylan/chitin deacetylase (PgdA/CDA1 family)
MKKRFLSLVLAFIMVALLVPMMSASASIPVRNRAIVFPYLHSGRDWDASFTHTSNVFTEFDITVEDTHVLEVGPWPRSDTMWIGNFNTCVILLRPTNPTERALPVTIESFAIGPKGEEDVKITDEQFWAGGQWWNDRPGTNTFFGGALTLSSTGFVNDGTLANQNLTIHRFVVADMPNTVNVDTHGNSAGVSPTLGPINEGEYVTVTIRVGEAPGPVYGDVNGDGLINASDTTMLRRYVAAVAGGNRAAFLDDNPFFNIINADVNGDKVIDSNDVTHLRRYLAATNAGDVRLGPPPPTRPDPPIAVRGTDRLIAITYDDGPCTNITPQVLDNLAKHTDRHGNKPRVTFYVVGGRINGATLPLLQRMINEGHDVDNHSNTHNTFGGVGGGGAGLPAITTTAAAIANINACSEAIFKATGFWPWSFRPPFFEAHGHMNTVSAHADTIKAPGQNALHFIFGAFLDTNDWQTGTGAGLGNMVMGWARNGHSSLGSGNGAHGGIVLFHDLYQWTADAVDHFVPQMMELGYVFVTVRQLFEMQGAPNGPPVFTGGNRTHHFRGSWF